MAKKSALHINKGVEDAPSINPNFRPKAIKSLGPEDLLRGILAGNLAALSKAITMVESTSEKDRAAARILLQGALPHSGRATRIGISGVPGVGKSTFLESYGSHLLTSNASAKVAVLAIDPSSSKNRGSILGDKTRMVELGRHDRAFIRPSASGGALGGVARATKEAMILCEAAGFTHVFVETVGVGQSETAVHSMVDFFLLLKIAGAGDELQGIKRGIMEMADAIVINKADGDNIKKASLARVEFKRALHLFPPKKSGWIPEVTTCSAITHDGIDAVWEIISNYEKHAKETAYFVNKRKEQNEFWMMETIQQHLKQHFYEDETISKKVITEKEAVNKGEKSPFTAAMELLDFYFKA